MNSEKISDKYEKEDDMAKKLVTYFSCSGVTARVAHDLAQAAGAELYEIKPVQPYTAEDLNWTDNSSRSSREMNDKGSRPAVAGNIDMEEYDTVFVGFPIWWGIAPRIVQTFLERYDFSGKTVIPFCTSGGSGVGRTDEVLHKCCSAQTKWKPCRRLSAAIPQSELNAYIASLKL